METVLITGAARRLGGHLAEALASDGCFVWIHYRNHEEEAFALRDKINEQGGSAACIHCDLTNTAEIDKMLERIAGSDYAELTTLINNASLFLNKTLQNTADYEWDMVMNTNLKAVWYLSMRFAERFSSAKRIITIGDASVGNPMPGHAVYALSKKTLKFLTEQMAAACAPKIRVNMLSPGLVLKGETEPDSIWTQRQERALVCNSDVLSQVTEGIRFLMRDPGMTGSELLIDNGVHLYNKNRF